MTKKNSEFGTKIINIEAGSLYEHNLNVREHYDSTTAMFTNSLLHDFLLNNGMKVKDGATRDIICIDFNYGSKSYDEHKAKLKELSQKAKAENNRDRRIRILELRRRAFKYRHEFVKKTKDELRDEFYKNGVDVKYTTYNKAGDIKREETIHYKMLYRSVGKAKKGSCMFIREKLYNKTYKFLTMGIKLPYENAPIVELGAYMSLVSSTIIGKIQIQPNEILVLNDIDIPFFTKIVSIETNENKECYAKDIDNYEVKNTLFDGQALVDSSIFPEWADGYILLRHHFCKMAGFNSNIQLFFKDYFGEKYETATVKDMFGNNVKVKDIKLITTNNAMKWLKLGVSYKTWCKRISDNDCMFGIVKTVHESKLGDVQRMSYQMVNSLDLGTMPLVAEKSIKYIEKLKTDDNVFLDYLEKNKNFSNDYEVLIALCKWNKDFINSEYYRQRKKKIIDVYILNFRGGKIIQDADNLTMCGSPYAMLLHSVGESVYLDDTMAQENGAIQCYTERFDDNTYLGAFRSPHNSRNNITPLHNCISDKMKRYFNLGRLCVAVNVIGTDVQDRLNGCDFDSDTIYTTNQPEIVNHALNCYKQYPTIVNNIPKEKTIYNNEMSDYATVDNNLAKSQMTIGESSNLAQIALTYTYNFDDRKYSDYVCILSVLAQCAIDSSKRRFDIDISKEIKRIKKGMDIKNNGYPAFWLNIRHKFDKEKINENLICPMNYLYELKLKRFRMSNTIPMENFFVKHEVTNRKKCKKVENFIQKYSLDLYTRRTTDHDEFLLLRSNFDELVDDIRQMYISQSYSGLMSWLIDRAFEITPQAKGRRSISTSRLYQNRSILIKVLYEVSPKVFLSQWKNTP